MILYLPALVAFSLGVVFLLSAGPPPWTKLALAVGFGVALLLQFRGTSTAAFLAGFLGQVALAIGLILWMKFGGDSGLDV